MNDMQRMRRRWVVLACGVAAGGVFAGAVVGAQFQPPLSDDLASALREEPLAKVADIPAANGLGGRGLFVQSTSSGFLCLWDAPSANALTRQGGCNRSNDPLAGRKMRISFAYDGGPAIGDVTDARLVGVASLDVAAAHVVMTDGTRRDLALKRIPKISGVAGLYRAFGHRLKSSDLKRGVGPAAVVALDSAGDEIDRHSTGFEG